MTRNVWPNFSEKPRNKAIDIECFFLPVPHPFLLWNQLLPLTKVKVKSLSRVRLFATPWTVAHQAPPSMGFSRQEYWSGLPFPSPGDLPNPGIEPRGPTLQADALTFEPPGKPLLWTKQRRKWKMGQAVGKIRHMLTRNKWSFARKFYFFKLF